MLNEKELFTIVRSILWCLPSITVFPSDEYIMELVKTNMSKADMLINKELNISTNTSDCKEETN